MSLIAQLQADGTFAESTSSASLRSSHEEKGGTTIDSEAFLTLLVAEMQNQDPLEPTSNTEWVSQYATFTEVSTIQEIGDAMGSVQAQGLVGKSVIMKVTDSTGNTNYIDGKVDRVAYEAGKAYLYIDGNPYSIDDLDTVISDEYLDATDKVADLQTRIAKLPELRDVTVSDQEEILALGEILNGLSEYEKQFLAGDEYDTMTGYVTKLQEVMAEYNAQERAQVLEDAIEKLPALDQLDQWGDDAIELAQTFVDAYGDLSQEERGYVSNRVVTQVGLYRNALETLKEKENPSDNITVSTEADAAAAAKAAQEALDAAEAAQKAAEEAKAAAENSQSAAQSSESSAAESAASAAQAQESGTAGEADSSASEGAIEAAGSAETASTASSETIGDTPSGDAETGESVIEAAGSAAAESAEGEASSEQTDEDSAEESGEPQ